MTPAAGRSISRSGTSTPRTRRRQPVRWVRAETLVIRRSVVVIVVPAFQPTVNLLAAQTLAVGSTPRKRSRSPGIGPSGDLPSGEGLAGAGFAQRDENQRQAAGCSQI